MKQYSDTVCVCVCMTLSIGPHTECTRDDWSHCRKASWRTQDEKKKNNYYMKTQTKGEESSNWTTGWKLVLESEVVGWWQQLNTLKRGETKSNVLTATLGDEHFPHLLWVACLLDEEHRFSHSENNRSHFPVGPWHDALELSWQLQVNVSSIEWKPFKIKKNFFCLLSHNITKIR